MKVLCTLKERGSEWSGNLDHLDSHLDPNQDHCQYIDTNCPLECHQVISKDKVEHHVTQECPKRPFVCKHCSLASTYYEIVEQHLPECKYVPVQCPNRCGVTCDREIMEDHMKICRLEEICCEMACVGCEDSFQREREEHMQSNASRYLSLTAFSVISTKNDCKAKLQEHQLMQEC